MHLPTLNVELSVYACRADTLLLVPSLCLPPYDAEVAFGPLTLLGTLAVDATEGPWPAIIGQIDRHLFATVARREGEFIARQAAGVAPVADAPLP